MKKVVFSSHAERKFDILERHGFPIAKDIILSTIESPDIVEEGHKGRKIAQRVMDKRHVIRIVYEDLPNQVRIITFYPGRRTRYEDKLR